MKHQMDVLRQTACQALAKHAPRQALAREMKLKCSKLFLAQPPPASPPASPHNLDPVLLLRQAVKKALLRSHFHDNMSIVAQELLTLAAHKDWRQQSAIQLQHIVRGYLVHHHVGQQLAKRCAVFMDVTGLSYQPSHFNLHNNITPELVCMAFISY